MLPLRNSFGSLLKAGVFFPSLSLQVKVQTFFQKSRKKKDHSENDPALEKEQAKSRKRVKSLVRRQKMTEAQKLIQQELELEEWGTEAQVKVCFLRGAWCTQKYRHFHSYFKILILISCQQLGTRLIELLLDSAFVQSPADQTPDSSPDIRPAFRHVLRQPIIENG